MQVNLVIEELREEIRKLQERLAALEDKPKESSAVEVVPTTAAAPVVDVQVLSYLDALSPDFNWTNVYAYEQPETVEIQFPTTTPETTTVAAVTTTAGTPPTPPPPLIPVPPPTAQQPPVDGSDYEEYSDEDESGKRKLKSCYLVDLGQVDVKPGA